VLATYTRYYENYNGIVDNLHLDEVPIYGSSRLGEWKPNIELGLLSTIANTFSSTRGEKSYELSNHLGNVLAVIDDRGQVLSASDYYAFGMELPGRVFNSSSYRYGMNTQEKDSEIAEGIMTATFWEYDSRIGRRWNIDPVVKEWESGYVTFEDNPIEFSDILGDTPSVNCPTCDKAKGAIAAFIDNETLGLVNLRGALSFDNAEDYNAGLELGDKASLVLSAYEVVDGGANVGASISVGVTVVAVEGGTGGLATPVVAPTLVVTGSMLLKGSLELIHGGLVVVKAKQNLSNKKGVQSTTTKKTPSSDKKTEPPTTKSRKGKDFTPKGKKQISEENIKKHGTETCEECLIKTTKPKKSKTGETPPHTDRQYDHIDPKSKGGEGVPKNGRVLCRKCNRLKSNH
jgi:hypothetical protein